MSKWPKPSLAGVSRPRPRVRIGAIAVSILVSLTTTSCALSPEQKTAIGTFADATTALSTSVSNSLPEMRSRVADMNTRWIAITNTADKGEPNPNEQLPDVYRILTVRGTDTAAFSSQNIALRIKAAQALHDYGDLLNQLAASDQSDKLKSAATTFQNSVKTFQDAAKTQALSSGQLDDVGTAVRAVGGLIIEWKRKRAVEKAVTSGETLVPRLSELLEKDFDMHGTGLAQGFQISENRLYTKADELLNPRERIFSCPPDPRAIGAAWAGPQLPLREELICVEEFSQRPMLVESYRTARDNEEWLTATAPKTVDALKKASTAHTEIAESLKAPAISFTSVTAFYNSVRDLVSEAKAIIGK